MWPDTKCNCCDGVYNSFDVHFTTLCDNKCKHCIDLNYSGIGISKPDVRAICSTILANQDKIDDVLFLGGEPCLFLEELHECIRTLRRETSLKLYVTTAVPKTCYDNKELFTRIIEDSDGVNLSVQHYNEEIADSIRRTISQYDRQRFYASLPYKEKIRINLNVVKPFLYEKQMLVDCLRHYDLMGFNSIKLSEIQHGKEHFVSVEDIFEMKLGSPYAYGCQKYVELVPDMSTPVLLKRSCFLCEETLKASISDGIKLLTKFFKLPQNTYGVVYEDGTLTKGWV